VATDADIDRIAGLAADRNVVAVGETGLDYYRTDEAGRPRQEESFRRHIAIAKVTGKALVIHDRDAHDDVLRVLDDEGAPEHVVFHCFSGDAAFARRCIDRGHVLSYAGNITFKNAQDLRDAAAITPPDQLLVETDAPFLTPMPYRGRPNASYLIPLTVRALAEIQGRSESEVATSVTQTAERVFRIS
jgi:TatD DNase family protein